ncbi:hypothetical protein [Variovorax sp. JS1663]|uniref:hypothetical protein n=1 Tax=Variovorax sp. JS1663 TaxID=1851577 RepID=UPI00267B66CA
MALTHQTMTDEQRKSVAPAPTCSPARAPATASMRTAPGAPACRSGAPAAGATCSSDFLIQRCFIYLDPDYAGKDTARYPWLAGKAG